jgi:hypothetical protein
MLSALSAIMFVVVAGYGRSMRKYPRISEYFKTREE